MSNFTFTGISSNPPYSSFREASINNNGTVSFEGFATPPSPYIPSVPTGIFTNDGEQTTTIVDSSSYLSKGIIQPTVGTSINDEGTVAYVKTDFDQSFTARYTGIFTSDNYHSVIDNFSSPYNFSFFWSPTINNNDTVAFLAGQGDSSTGLGGIYTISDGKLTTIADSSGLFSKFNIGFDTVGGNSPLSSYTSLSFNDEGTVAFNAGLDAGGQGIFTGNSQGVTTIADSSGNFNLFSSADINEQGTVAFLAQLDDSSTGIFTSSDGQIKTVADTSGDFSAFLSDPAINDQGTVAFQATLDNGVTGIFTGSNPVTDQVVAVGDQLFGSTVTNLLLTHDGLNDQGQLSFEVVLANGSDFVVRADPQYRPELGTGNYPGQSFATVLASGNDLALRAAPHAVPEPGESIVSVLALGILFTLGLYWRQKRFPKGVGS